MIATDDKLASKENCPYCSGTYSSTLSTTCSASTCCDHYTTVIYVEVAPSEDVEEPENYHYLFVIEELVLRRLQSRVWRLIEKTTCHTIKAKVVLRCNTPRNRGPPGQHSTTPSCEAATATAEVDEGGVVLGLCGGTCCCKDSES